MARVLSAPVGTFDSGSKMGAAIHRQVRSNTAIVFCANASDVPERRRPADLPS